MAIPFILTEDSASIFLDFVPFTVPATHPNWEGIVALLNEPSTTEADLRPLLDVAKVVSEFMNGAVEYRDRALYYNGKVLDTQLTRRIVSHMEAGQEGLAAPLIEFLQNVMQNPSRRAVLGLYDWAEKSGLPITPDGHILAYKIVNDDFTDCYTGTFDNSPGQLVEVPRNEVDEDPDRTCSYGLHVCSPSYLPSYGPSNKKVVIVKVDPADFVAVPRDYNTAKARVCRYEVLQEVPRETAKEFFPNPYVYDPTPEAKPKFEVGQVWLTREGDEMIIRSVDNNADGYDLFAVYAENPTTDVCHYYDLEGCFYNITESDCDLIAQVVKTGIDWAKPLESVKGEPVLTTRFEEDEDDGDYYVVSYTSPGAGWFYNLDGTHRYGTMPDLRNVAG